MYVQQCCYIYSYYRMCKKLWKPWETDKTNQFIIMNKWHNLWFSSLQKNKLELLVLIILKCLWDLPCSYHLSLVFLSITRTLKIRNVKLLICVRRFRIFICASFRFEQTSGSGGRLQTPNKIMTVFSKNDFKYKKVYNFEDFYKNYSRVRSRH